jgi:hypothetical protein
LIIPEFVTTGPTEIDYESMMFIIPVRVVIHNQGAQEASSFMVSITYTEYDEPYPVVFRTEAFGDSDPWSDMPLYPGESVVFEGVVLLEAWYEGSYITLTAIADNCGVYDPPGCWVEESDETNNTAEIPDVLQW